jgi:hypothetical protein
MGPTSARVKLLHEGSIPEFWYGPFGKPIA